MYGGFLVDFVNLDFSFSQIARFSESLTECCDQWFSRCVFRQREDDSVNARRRSFLCAKLSILLLLQLFFDDDDDI